MRSRRCFSGHVLEGSIRIEDHTVALQVEAEANIATAVPLPALEGGSWNLIYELQRSSIAVHPWPLVWRYQPSYTGPYGLLPTSRSIHNVQAGPVHIIPELETGTSHGVDYWEQPTTGSRLVDRTRDHTFSSATSWLSAAAATSGRHR